MEMYSATLDITNPFARKERKPTRTNLRVTLPARMVNFCHIKVDQDVQEFLYPDRVTLIPADQPGEETCPVKKYTLRQKVQNADETEPHINLVTTYKVELRRAIKAALPETSKIVWTWGEMDDGRVFWRGEIVIKS